jgi:hypothetical protein
VGRLAGHVLKLPAPKPPPYDPQEWRKKPWAARQKLACQAWAAEGYGAPPAIYLLYIAKAGLYVLIWALCCQLNAGSAPEASRLDRLMSVTSFEKLLVWSLLFEVLGLGCGSGPLTGRYWPPFTASLHFLRPGTIKLPFFRGLPVLGGSRRTWLDVALFLGLVLACGGALLTPSIQLTHLLPIVLLVPILGLSDKTIFLAARSEHYWVMLVCFCFGADGVPGAMVVATGIWMWAAISKMTHHFPTAVCAMTSNHPLMPWMWLRRLIYKDYPRDLRPARFAYTWAHLGTLLELCFPVLLLLGSGGTLTTVGLVAMVMLHLYITSNMPMGVPIEWNIAVLVGGFFLFGTHAQFSPLDIQSPALIAFLLLNVGLIPLVGHLWPQHTSFLMAMRYYAGNWAYSVWLFRGDAAKKLAAIPKASQHPKLQLARFYDEDTVTGLLSKVPAFRIMHLHGRALYTLIPKAVDDIEDYEYADGEIIAGMVLGYNFGDGHLHDYRLLHEVQAVCGFAPGELRHIFVESQPLFRPRLRWRIEDAATGLCDQGEITTAALLEHDAH